MKPRTILTAALLALAVAAPGHAQRWTPVRADAIRDEIASLDNAIDRADSRDTISEREAADLRTRLSGLRSQFQRLNANGLTRNEVRTLESRANYIRTRLKMEKADWGGRVG